MLRTRDRSHAVSRRGRLLSALPLVVSLFPALAHAAPADVVWTRTAAVTVAGSSLTKTGPGGWNGAGAVSSTAVQGTYFAEFRTDPATPPGAGDELAFGFVPAADGPPSSSTIAHGIVLAGGMATAFEAGVSTGVTLPYAAGDRFRVEAGMGFVRYRLNGRVFFRTIRHDSFAATMAAAVGLNRQGAKVLDARMASPNDARTDDAYFLDYQVPFQRLDGQSLAPPTDAVAAAAAFRQRQASVVAFEACGREVEFLTTLLQGAKAEWPEHKTIIGEEALGYAMAKLTWAAGLPDTQSGEPTLTPLQTAVTRVQPYPPCTAVIRLQEKDLTDLAAALESRLTVPPGAKPATALYDDLVGGAAVFNKAMIELTSAGTVAGCGNILTATHASAFPAVGTAPPTRVVTLQFSVPPGCMVAQITRLIGLMRVVDMPGSSDLPCNLLLGGLTDGEWDATVKEALRFYLLAKRYESGPAHGPTLDPAVLSHLRNDILTIDGPPDCESYSYTSCGCRNKQTGTPSERADEQGFWDDAWDAAGDVADWALRHWFLFVIFFFAIAIGSFLLGLGLSESTIATAAVVLSLATGDTVRIPETENHLLMIHSAKFLTNQIILEDLQANRGDTSAYDGFQSDVKAWLLKRMQQLMIEDFQEYNARPYQRYSIRALMNLADFSRDADVRTGAELVLQFAAAKAAVSTSAARRIVPFRRLTEATPVQELVYQKSHADFMVSMSLLWGGQTQQLPDGLMSGPSADEMITAATSRFTPSLQAFDLFANREAPYFQRLHHDDGGMEAYASTRAFLMTAGGLQTTPANKVEVAGIAIVGKPRDRGAAMPTMFMPATGFAQVARDDFIQIRGLDHEDDDHFDHNTCVWKGFACGVNIFVPDRLAIAPAVPGQAASCLGPASSGENLRFIDSDRCDAFNGALDPSYQYDTKARFYVAVYSRPCRPSSACDNFGFIDAIAVGKPASLSFSDFIRDETNRMIAWRTASRSDLVDGQSKSGPFRTANGDLVEFNPLANDDDSDDSGIISVNGVATATIDDWPLAEGDVITVLSDGKLRIRSPHMPTALILDFSNRSSPK